MSELVQTEQKKVDDIVRLMEDIDIETDCTPAIMGAINSVASSGGSPTEEAIKLLILKKRGVINADEYVELIKHFIETKKREK